MLVVSIRSLFSLQSKGDCRDGLVGVMLYESRLFQITVVERLFGESPDVGGCSFLWAPIRVCIVTEVVWLFWTAPIVNL